MSRDPRLYLSDIRESGQRVLRYTDGMDKQAFEEDQKTVDAVAWNLAIIGEAVKNLPEDTKAKAPVIEWRKIAGFRDVIVHGYFNLDTDILWDVVENKIEELLDTVEELSGTEERGD